MANAGNQGKKISNLGWPIDGPSSPVDTQKFIYARVQLKDGDSSLIMSVSDIKDDDALLFTIV